jgi:hypothetical protein
VGALQRQELGFSRTFGSVSKYTTAIGQLFYVESSVRIFCEGCGRIRDVTDRYWTLTLTECLSPDNRSGDECECEACGKSCFAVTEVLMELPLILTVRLKHWVRAKSDQPRRFDVAAFRHVAVSDRKHRLCVFMEYDVLSSEGGKFGFIFLSSSCTWNVMRLGTIESVPLAALDNFHPQLLFFTADDPTTSWRLPRSCEFGRKRIATGESENRAALTEATDSFVARV